MLLSWVPEPHTRRCSLPRAAPVGAAPDGRGRGGEAPPPAERRGGPGGPAPLQRPPPQTFPAPRATLLPKAPSPARPRARGEVGEDRPQCRGASCPCGPHRALTPLPRWLLVPTPLPTPTAPGPEPPNQLFLFLASGESSPHRTPTLSQRRGRLGGGGWGQGAPTHPAGPARG